MWLLINVTSVCIVTCVLYIVKAALHHSPLALVSSQGSQLNIIIISYWRLMGSSWSSDSWLRMFHIYSSISCYSWDLSTTFISVGGESILVGKSSCLCSYSTRWYWWSKTQFQSIPVNYKCLGGTN